jgi:hypothetical protein
MPLCHQGIELGLTNFYERELRGDEEPIEEHQTQNHEDFQANA